MARDGRWRKGHPDNPRYIVVPYKVGPAWTYRIETPEGNVVSPNPRARIPWNRGNPYFPVRGDAVKAARASCYYECDVRTPMEREKALAA